MSTRDFDQLSKEEQILMAVKKTLTNIIKDTATRPGMKHPLSDNSLKGLRDCLVLISQREAELAEAAGEPMNMRPRYIDEPQPQEDVVVPISQIGKAGKEEK